MKNIFAYLSYAPKSILIGVLALVGISIPLFNASGLSVQCNSNSVVYCGAAENAGASSYEKDVLIDRMNNGDGLGHTDIKQIYNDRGITEAGIRDAVNGTVTKTGDVVVDGNVVASNVWSSGRNNDRFGVSERTSDGLYFRPVSIWEADFDVWVGLDSSGNFQWAVMKSCGNPVQEIEKPYGVIYKQVTHADDGATNAIPADSEETALEANPGDDLIYQVSITNGGTATMTGTDFSDQLPNGVSLTNGSDLRNLTQDVGSLTRYDGDASTEDIWFATINITVDEDALDGFGNERYITNTACFTADDGQNGCDDAVIRITDEGGDGEEPDSSFACTSLQTSVVNKKQRKYKFTPVIAINEDTEQGGEVNITEYRIDYGDGNSDEESGFDLDTSDLMFTHQYAKDGDYTITFTIEGSVDGSEQISGDNCVAQLSVDKGNGGGDDNGGDDDVEKLPQTGPAETAIAGLFGTSGFAYVVSYYRRAKQGLLEALLQK